MAAAAPAASLASSSPAAAAAAGGHYDDVLHCLPLSVGDTARRDVTAVAEGPAAGD